MRGFIEVCDDSWKNVLERLMKTTMVQCKPVELVTSIEHHDSKEEHVEQVQDEVKDNKQHVSKGRYEY